MKNFYKVSNTIENGPRMDRKRTVVGPMKDRVKSRISPINHRLWTVIGPMLFVAFGLFGVNDCALARTISASGGGDCPNGNIVLANDTISVTFDPASGSFSGKDAITSYFDLSYYWIKLSKGSTNNVNLSWNCKTAGYSVKVTKIDFDVKLEGNSQVTFYSQTFNTSGSHEYRKTNSSGFTSGMTIALKNTASGLGSKNREFQFSNISLTYDAIPRTYSITLDNETPTTSGSKSVTLTFDSKEHADITNPQKTNYTFAGWYSGDNGTGSLVIDANGNLQANVDGYTGANGIWRKDATTTLYAKWTATYYGRAQAYSDPAAGGGVFVNCGSSATPQYATTKTSNWNQSGLTSAPSCTAYFYAQANDGYEFVGWYPGEGKTGTKKSGSASYSEAFTVESIVSGTPTVLTRYAYFEALQYYYFKAQANKVGEGTVYASFVNGTYTAATATTNERAETLAQTQSASAPTAYFRAVEKDGSNYHFAGWYTDAECTNRVSTEKDYSVSMGNSSATSSESPLTKTLYAKFVEELTPEITANYVEGAPTQLLVEGTIENAFSFLNTTAIGSGLSVTITQDSDVLAYNSSTNLITALREGDATITFEQAATGVIKEGAFSFDFHVSRVANTIALKATSGEAFVLENVSDVLKDGTINSNATIKTQSTSENIAHYDIANDRIVVDNSGDVSFNDTVVVIKIWQDKNTKYAASDTLRYTLTVNKYEPTMSVSTEALELEQTATLTTSNTTSGMSVDIDPAEGVLSYADGVFTAVGAGDATVTVTQPETRTVFGKQEEFNFHVSKKTPTLVVKMDGTAATSKSVSRGTVVNVTFEDNSDADVVVTNVSGARAASYINGQMTAGYVGTAVYRASLVETDTYQAKTVDFSLTVTSAASDHVPYTNATGYTIGSGSATDWTHSYETIHFNGIPDKLTFNYAYIFQVEEINLFGKKISIGNPTLSYDALDDFAKAILNLGNYSDTRKGVGNAHMLYVEESADGNTWSSIWTNDDASSKDTKYSGEIQLQRTTRYIRFHHSSNFSNSYTNINISELRYVEAPDPASVDFGSAIINSGEVSKKVMINWCNIAPLTVTSSNDRFYVSPLSFGNYENYGTQELTIRFSHEEEGSFSGDITISNGVDTYDKTIHVTAETTKRPQTITWNSDLVATGYAMNVGEQYPDEVITTIATATNGGKITYTSDKTDVIEVIDGVSLSAVGTGKANITAYQAGDDDFKEVYDTKEFTVTELQKQVITWNQNLYGLLTTSENMTLNATATSGMAITYESADENVVRVEGNTLIVVGEGETYITASQAGGKDANDVEWLPISQNNYVIVRDPNSPCNGMALSIGSLTLNSGKLSQDTTLSGIPAVLTFTAKHGTKNASTWGSAIYSALIVYQYAQIENLWGWYEVYNQVVGTGDTPSGDIILDETATKIRFKTLETGTDHTISNIRVTRPKFMNSDVSEVDQEVETNALWQKTVTISHSNIDVMNISTKKGLLTLSTSSLGDGCEDSGEDQFVVSYTPKQKDAEYLDTIVITDSKAEPTMITIPIRLHTTGWNQEIENFNLPAAALTTDALALTATATSGLDVRYESTDEAIVRIVNGNELEIITSGTVAIKAIQDGNNRYYETYAEKSITISKVVPALIAPVGTDVTYLAALSTSSLSDGSATVTLRGVENTLVEGTFDWTNPEQQITANVGAHSYSVTFTPNDAAYYAPATTMVEINVIAATPVATPSAANIVYGQKVKESELSNEGTEGKWAWNTGNNEAVLDAGTHEGLAVHFTPTSGNYTELDTTVSLTVEKAAASLSWTTAPTELAFNATGVTYEASSVSDGVISYSIVSGNEYAEINAEGALTILVPGQTVTVQAAQAEGTNYLAPEAITVNVTIGAAPSTNTFTNLKGDGNWYDPENWESGIPSGNDPDVIISGALIIDESVTVGGLTILPTGGVTIVDDGKLTVNGASDTGVSGYGNLYVANGGEVEVAGSLTVRDLIVEASIGTSEGNAESGQVASAENIVYTNAYIDINMDPSGFMDDTKWYGFTVPFAVDAYNGVSRKEGTTYRQCGYSADYVIAEYDADKRLNTGKGWKYISGNTLNAGQFYFFGVNGSYNTYRFKASGNSYTPAAAASLYVNGSTTNYDANWNGVGNSTLQHVTASYTDGEYVQVYMNGQDAYKTVNTNDATFVVGCPFFVQAKVVTTLALNVQTATAEKYYAPRRAQEESTDVVRINLSATDGGYSDQIYFCAADKEQDAYIIGQDLSKAGVSDMVPQLWMAQYNQKLSVHEAVWNGDQATCPLGIYVPKNGEFVLTATQPEDGTQIYLTENGAPIWDLTMSEYVLSLEKGNTSAYGLKVVRAPQVTTGVDETEASDKAVRKVIIDNTMYIITPEGTMFNVIGKKVQ